jgi:hypothetical protein
VLTFERESIQTFPHEMRPMVAVTFSALRLSHAITESVFRLAARRTCFAARTPNLESAPVSEKRSPLSRVMASKFLNSGFVLFAKCHLAVAQDVKHPEFCEDNHPTYIPSSPSYSAR